MATWATRSSSSGESSENRGTRPKSSTIPCLAPFSIPYGLSLLTSAVREKCGGQAADSRVRFPVPGRSACGRRARGMDAMRAATTKEIAAAAAASGPGAAGEACRAAGEGLSGDPGLLLAFTSGDSDFERDAEEMADAAAGTISAGMTGKGLFGPDGPLDEGCVAMAFTSQVSAGLAVAEDASADLRTAGQACTADAIERLGADPDLVLLLIDSSRGDIADTVAGAYEAAG